MDYEEEAKKTIEQELQIAIDNLKEKGIARTDKNLLNEFAENIEKMLVGHFKNMNEWIKGMNAREAELYKWLLETKKMMKALTEYKEKIDNDAFNRFSFFCDTVEKEVESKFKAVLRPSAN